MADGNVLAAPVAALGGKRRVVLSAWLDQHDRIVHLSPGWDDHVDPAFASHEILARPLGRFIADTNLRECYRVLVAGVRQQRRASRLMARVDTAFNEPRALQLSVIPLSAGAIELTWAALEPAAASRMPLRPAHTFQEGELLRMCGWCHDVNLGARWERLEDAASALGLLSHGSLPAITHGICPACCGAVAAESIAERALPVAV